MKYEGKFIVNGRGFRQTVEAENETMAKQKILASIEFVSINAIIEPKQNLDDIFGAFGQIFKP